MAIYALERTQSEGNGKLIFALYIRLFIYHFIGIKMKRFHIHLAVDDLDRNIGFYSTLFGCEPTDKHHDLS